MRQAAIGTTPSESSYRRPLHVVASEKLLVHGKRLFTIALISVNGMLVCKTVTGSLMVHAIFYNFVQISLLHHLMATTPTVW